MKDLAVVLLNWNDENTTAKCLETIRCWKLVPFEIIIVDNHSSDDRIRSPTHPFNAFHLIHNSVNSGYAGGNNLGIIKAKELGCPLILLLNTDAFISEQNVTLLIRSLKENPEIDITGPVIRETSGDKSKFLLGGKDIARNINTRIVEHADMRRSQTHSPFYEVDYVPGTVFLVRSTLFDEIGLLDERFFISGEMADFCKRAKEEGKKAFVNLASIAEHQPEIRSFYFRDVLYPYYSLRNRFLYLSKHHHRDNLMLYPKWIIFALRQWTGATTNGNFQKARAIMLALIHGLTGTFRNQNHKFTFGI